MMGKVRQGFFNLFKPFIQIDRSERVKLALLTAVYFLVIASYTLVKELKDSIFMTVVGNEYLPVVKTVAIAAMVPSIMLYAFLVDRVRRYQLLALYSVIYGLFGLMFVYFIGHPTIGLANTVSGYQRIFGWVYYFFIEGYSPFIVGVFWAFSNSITSPDAAKKNYGLMVAGSKLGGLSSALLAWYFLSPTVLQLSDVAKHQVLSAASAGLLLLVPLVIWVLTKKVPGRYLHGYEAAYQLEKEKAKSTKEKMGIMEGFQLLIQHPYVLGIFGYIFFYEVGYAVLDYQRKCLISNCVSGIGGLSRELFWQVFLVHTIGCIISLVGTSALMRKLGERRCLLLVPIVSGLLFTYFVFTNTLSAMVIVFVGLRAINYGFSYPVRESLYIPTIKDIKFKSKSWIDAFGIKFAKGCGAGLRVTALRVLANFGESAFVAINGAFLLAIVACWTVTAFLLGKRFQKAIDNNEVIGAENSTPGANV